MPTRPGFLPSRDGLAYVNAWPSQPAVVVPTPFGRLALGDPSAGLCGGMVFAALDHWYAGSLAPVRQPRPGEPGFRYLVKRLVQSWRLPVGVGRYYWWMILPDGADQAAGRPRRLALRGPDPGWRTRWTQWPRIQAELDQGRPVPLGVVMAASANPRDLKHNHQVLAYDYHHDHDQAGGRLTVRVYDPNRGRRDDIAITVTSSTPDRPVRFSHNLGLSRPVRGFFRTAYTPAGPPAR